MKTGSTAEIVGLSSAGLNKDLSPIVTSVGALPPLDSISQSFSKPEVFKPKGREAKPIRSEIYKKNLDIVRKQRLSHLMFPLYIRP